MRKKAGRSTNLVSADNPPLPPGLLLYECTFGAETSLKNIVLDDLLAALQKSGAIVDDGDEIRTRLCLDEALINALIHGSKNDAKKSVLVHAYQSDTRYSVLVEDDGDGFCEEDLPDAQADENSHETGGRGVHLIRSIMDDISYWRGGRTIFMSRLLKGKGLRRSSTRIRV